jgi:hypothetical protein
MKDPAFLKEAETANIEVDPVRGENIQRFVEQVLATPKHVKDRAKPIFE